MRLFSFTMRLSSAIDQDSAERLAEFSDGELLAGLSNDLPDVTVTVEDHSPALAVTNAVWKLRQFHDAVVTKIDEDLVSISVIAERLSLSRETVRKWAVGTRRSESSFPEPFAVVGDGIRVWAWGDVHAWATTVSIAVEEALPLTSSELCQANAWLVLQRTGGLASGSSVAGVVASTV